MTVCIAALAQNGRAIVVVSDKALTYGYGQMPARQDDADVQKILPIGKSGWVILTAGDGGTCDRIARELTDEWENNHAITDDASTVAKRLQEIYRSVRDEAEEQAILAPKLLTREAWESRSHSLLPLPDEVVHRVLREMEKFSLGVALVVCGFDKNNNANLLSVGDSGVAENLTNDGIVSIDVGSDTATGRLLWEEYKRGWPLEEVLYSVFDAKAHSEQIQGVGFRWDAKIIVGKKVIAVKGSIKSLVEKVFEHFEQSPFKTRRSAEPKNWGENLRAYAQGLFR